MKRIRCLKCNDIIEGDKQGTLIKCKCGACSIKESEDFFYINGDPRLISIFNEKGLEVPLAFDDDLSYKPKYERINKIDYYLNIAETASERSTCLKRHYGAIIVNNDEIISTGYSGAPRGLTSCLDRGYCLRQDCPRGVGYENCVSTHAEMNAIISASRRDMIGSTMYLVGKECENGKPTKYVENPAPCSLCKRLIINSGITNVIVRTGEQSYKELDVSYWNEKDITGGY